MDALHVTRNGCWGDLFRPLPISAEVHARLRRHRQCHHVPDLSAVIGAAVILAPRALLRVADQVGAQGHSVLPLEPEFSLPARLVASCGTVFTGRNPGLPG